MYRIEAQDKTGQRYPLTSKLFLTPQEARQFARACCSGNILSYKASGLVGYHIVPAAPAVAEVGK